MDDKLSFLAIPQDGKLDHPLPEIATMVCQANSGMYQKTGFQRPWVGYLVQNQSEYIGTCAFKGPPQDGRVEIAYFTFPGHEGQGYATMMAKKLISIAKETKPDIVVFAQTLPEENASTCILKKLNFQLLGPKETAEDGLVWEWEHVAD